jgi:hypothetical protein
VNESHWIERVNQAMLDAAELAANPIDPDSAIRTYEEAMFTRTDPIAEMSARVQSMMLAPTAADDITRFFTARPTEPAPADRERAAQPASPLWTPLPWKIRCPLIGTIERLAEPIAATQGDTQSARSVTGAFHGSGMSVRLSRYQSVPWKTCRSGPRPTMRTSLGKG